MKKNNLNKIGDDKMKKRKSQTTSFAIVISVLLIAIMGTSYSQTATTPAAGDGSLGNPYQIATLNNLYWITAPDSIIPQPNQATRQSSHYIQTANIDASPTQNWFSDGQGGFMGWIPIFNFSGSFDGANKTITGLYINRKTSRLGLFGTVSESGSIKNVGLVDAEINAHTNNLMYIGSLVGFCLGKIDNSYAISEVDVTGGLRIGGLVGELYYEGVITNSNTEGTVVAVEGNALGGLVGLNRGVIHNSHSSSNVTGGVAGGLVGSNTEGFITHCYATGNVTESGISGSVGGLVGDNSSNINYSYSTGNVSTVSGTGSAGGLVGNNSRVIKNSYATGAVTGANTAGGLVASSNGANALIENCYALGDVTNVYSFWNMAVGGFIGNNAGSSKIINSYSRGNVFRNHEYAVTYFGGFAGWNRNAKIINCFSTGSVAYLNAGNPTNKGFVGVVDTTGDYAMSGNYWNIETSFQSTSAGNAEGRTTSQMTYPYAANTFVGWNFNQIWAEDQNYTNNNGYPYIFVRDTVSAPLAGDGSEGNPYEISSFEHLLWLSSPNDVVAFPPQSARWKSHYKQVADIDASASINWTNGFAAIGLTYSNYFSGSYDGQNYSISNLYIKRSNENYQGFFGFAKNSVIKNLRILNADVTGQSHTGCLAGQIENSIAENITVSGNINGKSFTGGLIGYVHGSTVSNSSVNGNVTGTDYTGGLIGTLVSNSILKYSSSKGSVTGTVNVGGLVGSHSGTTQDSYSRSSVNGGTGNYVGGLMGSFSGSSISNCYSTGAVNSTGLYVGGFFGLFSSGTVLNCYWDTETSGKPTSAGGAGVMGRTTSEMTFPFAANTYTDWNFNHIWGIDSSFTINDGYPYIHLRDTTSNISDIIEQPTKFSLSQNYPNPFNPVTKIRYSIPSNVRSETSNKATTAGTSVKLIVFDILGNEVTTLVNEIKAPGNYEIEWNAAGLASGIYFYRLKSGSHIDVKKMVLIR